jgi:hypothetical protein
MCQKYLDTSFLFRLAGVIIRPEIYLVESSKRAV